MVLSDVALQNGEFGNAAMIELLECNNFPLNEEIKYLREIFFPWIGRHAEINTKFISYIFVMKENVVSGKAVDQPIGHSDSVEFFHAWIGDHIFKEDRKFARYLYSGYPE